MADPESIKKIARQRAAELKLPYAGALLPQEARVLMDVGAKLVDIERRIKQLRAVRSALRKLVDTCRSDGSTRACPILEALTEGDGDDV